MRVLLKMKLKNETIFRANIITPVFLLLFFLVSRAQNPKSSMIDIGTSPGINLPVMTESNKALLDQKIDPDTYILGPGDVLSIFTWGAFQGQYQLTISPEGMLLVPEVGPIDVADLTLTVARQKIADDIKQKYRNVECTISLVDLRNFKVYVGGAVINPGAYPATPMTRVSEVISAAGGFFVNPNEDNTGMTQTGGNLSSQVRVSSKRNIAVYRRGGDTLWADVLRLNLAGDPVYNPRLREGDEIVVPYKENSLNQYGIFGAVRNPGFFEYSNRDSLIDLMNLGHGLTMNADSTQLEIVRFRPDNVTTYSMKIDLTANDWNIPLKPDDRVFIKSIQGYHEKYQVQLLGEFKYPGFYAITEDSTLLSEIVDEAGGLTDMASLEEAEMTRASSEELADPEFERLKKMNVADMSESEYGYFKIKSRSKAGRVAVDFPALFIKHDATKNIYLRSGDIINVPRKRQVVSVMGEAANPGFISYIPSKDYIYYIRMAGGYSDRAGRGDVSIIKPGGEWKSPKKGAGLEAGDTVWIPEKKKHNYLGTAKDLVLFIGNMATIYLVIRQATQ
jgi:protein involved in polysaccharide export with SLBB domain